MPSLTRRGFLTAVAASSATAALARAHGASVKSAAAVEPRAIIQRGLEVAKKHRATYADVRIERLRAQGLFTRDEHLQNATDHESYGLGVRVIVDGTWGFACTPLVTLQGAAQAATEAVAVAVANRQARAAPIELAPAPRASGRWQSPVTIDPFTVPLDQKVDALLDAAKAALAVKGAQLHVRGSLEIGRHEKTFGSSEGSFIEQVIMTGHPELFINAVDTKRGEFESGNTAGAVPPAQIGFEVFDHNHFSDVAVHVTEAVIRRLGGKPVTPGKYDLVLAPSHLWLTIHESVGHPTELDRALGYEANFAGTSFATPDQIGKLRYGTEIVNVVADRQQPRALATCGWDVDGVAADKWDLIKDGMLVGFQTTRDQAGWIGEKRSHGTSYAESWSAVPFQRMPNVSLQPGTARLTPEELIADTKRGIYIEGNGSWSIDQQRYNFQFGGQAFSLIENGKLTTPLRFVAYQSNSVDFWRTCDAICDERDYRLGGSLHDGKGEPPQSNPVSHGCATSRFRQINVLNSRGQS